MSCMFESSIESCFLGFHVVPILVLLVVGGKFMASPGNHLMHTVYLVLLVGHKPKFRTEAGRVHV